MFPSILTKLTTLTASLHLSSALTLYAHHLRHLPSPTALSHLLRCSLRLNTLPTSLHLHAHALVLGVHPHASLAASLISLYSPSPSALFAARDSHFPLPWNTLIASYIRSNLFLDALEVYREMGRRGVVGDVFTYPSVLKACGVIGDVRVAEEVWGDVRRNGLETDLFVGNALVSMWARVGELGRAREVFDGMRERDVVSWNAMISGYAKEERWGDVVEVFGRMRGSGVGVNVVTWNVVAGGLLAVGDSVRALSLVGEVGWSGFGVVDHVTFVVGLRACSRMEDVRFGKEIHGMVIRMLCERIETVKNALITMYSRCGDVRSAHVLFQRDEERSLITWNCMITGFCVMDMLEDASVVFREMVWSGIEPNYVTVVTILSLCARIANLHHGRELHCYVIKHSFEDHKLLWNSLVDMYSKSGRIVQAKSVFESIKDQDEVSYTSMIAGYGMQGDGRTALKLFDEMILGGTKPDNVALVAVLSACSHSKLVEQGKCIFEKMTSSYGIVPSMEHYSCMVDLYARAGMLNKAFDFLSNMPLKPSAAMWASLVGACHVYRNTTIGEKAARTLLEMIPENPGHYVLIANMYAASGCWTELARVRTLMRDIGIRKVPGCAWVEEGNVLHSFSVGDHENSESCETYRVLGEMNLHLKDAGYIGNEYLGFDEEVEG